MMKISMTHLIKIASLISLLLVLLIVSCTPPTGSIVVNDECSSFEGRAKDNCYFENLKCSKMADEFFRDSCVAELAKIKQDVEVCDLIKSSKTKAYCQEQIAVLNNNHDLCTKIEDGYWEDNCHFYLAVNNNKDVYCSLISNAEQQRKECFKTIAVATDNHLLCEALPVPADKTICMIEVAIGKKNPDESISICQEINTGSFDRDLCRYRVAKISRNKAICELIGIKEMRQTCNSFFAGNNT